MTNERARARALCMNEYDRNIVSLLSKLFNIKVVPGPDHPILQHNTTLRRGYTKAAPLHQREGCSLGSSTPEKRRRRKKWRLISISRCLLAPLLSFYEGVGIDGRRGGGGKAEDGSLGPLRLSACLPLPLAGLVWFEREYDTEGLHSFQFYFRLSQKESY